MTYAIDYAYAAGSAEYTGKDHIKEADLKSQWSIEPLRPEHWSQAADRACNGIDPELFFQEKGGTNRPAKRICNGTDKTAPCPYRDLYLRDAIERGDDHGVFGGVSPRGRLAIKRGKVTAEEARQEHYEPPMITFCSVDDCDGVTKAKGLCSKHHMAAYRKRAAA